MTPGEINEILAVDRAQMHANNKSLSWKQYIQNLDLFLELEINSDEFNRQADFK